MTTDPYHKCRIIIIINNNNIGENKFCSYLFSICLIHQIKKQTEQGMTRYNFESEQTSLKLDIETKVNSGNQKVSFDCPLNIRGKSCLQIS